jgi:tRNA 2-thiouridine synthesizing protein D
MKFAIQINCSPTVSPGALTAYQFVKTALDMQHEIVRVFFYHEGIYHAFAQARPPEDEISLTQLWSRMASDYQLDLAVCISAAQRRGLLCADEAKRRGKTDRDLAAGFRIAGLGLWVEATLLADRCLVFS